MRHLLLVTTCIAALAPPAAAETVISTTVTGPVGTATVRSGGPDDIVIGTVGTVNATAAGGVIVNSNNRVTNQGNIQSSNLSNIVGIDVQAGVTGNISNSGKITLDETYAPTDTDNDGDLDGPFAIGSNRIGIRTLGAFIGNIVNNGTISIEGNNSAGISLGGPLTGNFTQDGTINVVGTNALGVGLADVTGNVRLAGKISVQGEGATAIRSAANVNGAMVIQGAIQSTGYRHTTAPADPSKLDSDDLLQGSPAVSIEGSVTKGIILAIPPKDTKPDDKDEDRDGIEDSKEGSAAVASYGAAPAMRIGSASAINIGATEGTGTGFGLIVEGAIIGDGVYSGVNGNALQIGGLGGTVTIANGIGVSGSITARSIDRAATAVSLGSGAATPDFHNSGKINATSGNVAASNATAVSIASGASLPTLRNSGEIKATTGANGTATAIVDRSGTLALIQNSGTIAASGPVGASGRAIAIDLSSNLSGATVRQTVVASGFPAPSIAGDVKFGSGSDLLDIADGKLSGNVAFGEGSNQFRLSGNATADGNLAFGSGADSIGLSGTSKFKGNVDFGGGADVLTIGDTSSFTGQLSNSAGLSVNVSKGSFGIVKAASIASLSVTDGGILSVTLDKTPGNSSSLNVSGTASFATGSKLQLSVANVAQAEGVYQVLTAGTLTGGSNLSASTDLLPFLYKGVLSVTGNQLSVDISRKSASELGLNRSESAAYAAVYKAIGTDNLVGNSFLALRNQEEFVGTFRQMLPDHAGGTFEAATLGDRTFARTLADPKAPYKQEGRMGYWLGQAAWGSTKGIGDTAGFKVGGWGINGGAELSTAAGKFGASLAYLWGRDADRATDNDVSSDQYSLAAHWRHQKDGFQAVARTGFSHLSFDSTRRFTSNSTSTPVEKTIEGSWTGKLFSASANLSQELWSGSFFVKPAVGVDYYRLTEKGYRESGGGSALDLTVDGRTSSEAAVNALLAAGFEVGATRTHEGYFRLEIEGGRRQILSGSLGETKARFAGGETFTLEPEQRQSGWLGRIRGIGGGADFRVAGEIGAEERDRRVGVTARASVSLEL